MVWIIIIFILLCCCFGGWGIVIGIGMIALVLFSTAKQESARNDLMYSNRAEIVNASSADFRSTKSIANSSASDYAIYIDEVNRKIMFTNFITKARQLYRFNEIIECSILEDGAAVQTGGVGRAVAGGIIAGGVGAVVGASTRKTTPTIYSLSIRIVTTNIQCALYEIPIITSKTEKDTSSFREKYQFAQEVYAVVNSIMAIARQQQAQT